MNLHTFSYERDSLTLDRQKQGLKVLFDTILNDVEHFEGLIDSILECAVLDEEMDMFGTEGLDV